MPEKLTTRAFIEKARAVHGERYDYSRVEYVNKYTKVEIICPEHGPFWQGAFHHWSDGDCPRCNKSAVKASARLTEGRNEFIRLACLAHGKERYDYSQVVYTASKHNVIIICPEHGQFTQRASRHLSGSGCHKCASKVIGQKAAAFAVQKASAAFVKKAQQKHGNKYDYSQVVYAHSAKKVTIRCPIHGEFEQRPASHILGRGCDACSRANIPNGASRSGWIALQNGRKAILYIVELKSSTETFYKVGITYNLDRRFIGRQMPYSWRTLATYKSYNASEIYDLENLLHREFKHAQYRPQMPFGGQTECFNCITPILEYLPSGTIFLP